MLLVLGLVLASLVPGTPEFRSALVSAARRQIGVTVRYDGSYTRLSYPGGDVPLDRGVCTDVVVRAYRELGIDLQVLVHREIEAGWADYPRLWGLARPDPNIDHRRVPNLATFFRRRGRSLPVARDPGEFREGDIVTWRLPNGLPHVGIVSARRSPAGTPLVIHNIGAGAAEEDVLFAYAITGHFQFPVRS